MIHDFLNECKQILNALDANEIDRMATVLAKTRERGGRLFLLGSGGGAGHASHAVCDFRKLCGFEAYSPYDNVSELTARVNDEGWDTTISNWLKGSRLRAEDCLFVFSVGGGNAEHAISMNLVNAVAYAKEHGASVVGVVGRDGGYTKAHGDAVLLIPTVNEARVTPLTEGFQALIWHLLVSHPALQQSKTKWEAEKP